MTDRAQDGPTTYRAAGVDIDEGNAAVRRLKTHVESTRTPRVVGGVGAFAGFFAYPDRDSMRLLVASTDGVGTKLKILAQLGDWHGAGYDIVSHCVSDILVHGARPIFFLDYIAMGRLSAEVVSELVRGMAEACRLVGCALLGGETAEMPGVYAPGECDVVGTLIGEIERARLLDGSAVRPGDVILGLASEGLHTNGYALARRIVGSDARPGVLDERPDPDGPTWGQLLGARHHLYFSAVHPLLEHVTVHGMAHITGGGLTENLPRILPEGCQARIDPARWPIPDVFRHLVARGRVAFAEAHRVWNMGIGYVVVLPPEAVQEASAFLAERGESVHEIGTIERGEPGVCYP